MSITTANQTKNIMIAGVGGQGTLLASRLLGHLLLKKGYDLKISEVHGMSQRGGSVVTYVRYGKKVHSPVIEKGEADILLSFELLEAARYLPYVKEGGLVVSNTGEIDPIPVITGAMGYPKSLEDKLEQLPLTLDFCDALALAEQAGSARTVNVVLLGVLAKHLDFPLSDWEDAVREIVPPRFTDMNLQAFALGYKAE